MAINPDAGVKPPDTVFGRTPRAPPPLSSGNSGIQCADPNGRSLSQVLVFLTSKPSLLSDPLLQQLNVGTMPTSVDLEEGSEASSAPHNESDSERGTEEGSSESGNIYEASDLKLRLLDCLDDVQCAGSFACFETALSAVNPGIFVEDIGVVGLPLGERDANILIGQSHQSPFGRGSETII